MKVQHFVLTRFNLRINGFLVGNRWRGGDPDYLEKRFELFEKYTLPAMRCQDCEFIWLVFFSRLTPEKYKKRAMSYSAILPSYEAVFVDDTKPLDNMLYAQDAVLKRLSIDADYYITTRIDNDDAFNVKALKTIYNNALMNIKSVGDVDKFIISCINGYAFNEKLNFLQYYTWDLNHFLSLVCNSKSDVLTILNFDHSKPDKDGIPVCLVEEFGMWVEIVNGTNLLNYLRLYCKPCFHTQKWYYENFRLSCNVSFSKHVRAWLFTFLPLRIKAYIQLCIHRVKKLCALLFSKKK